MPPVPAAAFATPEGSVRDETGPSPAHEKHSAFSDFGKPPQLRNLCPASARAASFVVPLTIDGRVGPYASPQEVTIARRHHPARFGDEALRVAPVRRRLPVDCTLEGSAREDQLARDLPDRRCAGGGMIQQIEDRQQERQPVALVGGRFQDGPGGCGSRVAPVIVKGTERGERERHRAIRPDDIACGAAMIGYQEAVACALTHQH